MAPYIFYSCGFQLQKRKSPLGGTQRCSPCEREVCGSAIRNLGGSYVHFDT